MPDGSTIGLVLGSSVLAVAVTQGFTVVRDMFARNKTADYSALYLAMSLESYGRSCSELLSESEMSLASEGNAGRHHGSLIDMPDPPTTVDWRALGIDITAEALALPVLIATTNSTIKSLWDISEEESALVELHEAAAEIGLQCFDLARSVREKRSIPPLVLNQRWNAFSHLNDKQSEYASLKLRREADHREMMASMFKAAEMVEAQPACDRIRASAVKP